jgi:hypothetical protein
LTVVISASPIFHLQLRLDRFIIDFVLNLVINILIGFGCRADRFSNTGTAASRERKLLLWKLSAVASNKKTL